MNEGRLPSWVRFGGGARSPRRVSQFEEHHHHHHHRHRTAATTSTTAAAGFKQPPPPPPSRHEEENDAWKNPFISGQQQQQDYALNHDLVQNVLSDDDNNRLVMHCRQGLWEQALEQCLAHPHQAQPVVACTDDLDFFQEMWSLSHSKQQAAQVTTTTTTTLYETTPLGMVCSCNELPYLSAARMPTLTALVTALAQQGQVALPQHTVGNTPLKQAMVNTNCPPAVIAILLQQPGVTQALHQADELGLYPLDYLLQRVRKLVVRADQVALLQAFLQHVPRHALTTETLEYSPLVRFYSTSVSPGVGMHSTWRQYRLLSVPTTSSPKQSPSQEQEEDNYVVLVTSLLLQALPGLLTTPSPTTGCLPIHAALRNHGNHTALLQVLLLLSSDDESQRHVKMMLHRNHFGDTALHVACACGVPLPVLRLVLARTVQAAAGTGTMLWSTNHAGYTPIDLEWIRHIEAGNGFLSQAVFQPIGVEGIPRPRGRYNDLYDKLLRQAVDQVMGSNQRRDQEQQPFRGTTDDDTPSSSSMGLLLHRIFLIIRATFSDSFSTSPFDLSGDILHQASALFQPYGPSMPAAIMDLLLWQYPEQVEQRDHLGRTPLHHAVQMSCTGGGDNDDSSVSERKRVAWERWVLKLVSKSSRAVLRTVDARGRYPLHAALDGKCCVSAACAGIVQYQTVIMALATGAPEALQVRDQVSRLFPAVQAASHPLVPLDTVYWLLRRAPGVLS